ncbi:DUF4175 family protein [uncultured Sphingomonas sp.]|uniref:DUF4175 family protein n=1 Tax=uncultured Sphingomonas sp. TaxID=158754 RepID=UPI0025F3A19B|nr:DUF4175 family protein [uncultured Sphingomonas sp.]
MSPHPLVQAWSRPVRQREAAITLLMGAPVLLVAAVMAWRLAGQMAGLPVLLIGLASLILIAWRRTQRFDGGWLIRALNGARADLEDSSELLFSDPAALGPLQRLQQARIHARVDALALPDLRKPWPHWWIALLWIAGLAICAALILLPDRHGADTLAPSTEAAATIPGVPHLVGQRLRIVPPAYTGLPARDLDLLDAKAPQGSRLIWTLAFAPEPTGASLAVLGGRPLALRRSGDRWSAVTILDASMLYRIMPAGARAQARPHRIEAIPDQPPAVSARTPARTLSIAATGQRAWPLVFEATDDYGVAPQAELTLTVAAGEGENVSFREHRMTLRGSGPARQRRFATTLDLAALGFTGPGDLVAQLTVRDGRAPSPQVTRSPSLILRRLPPAASEGTGIDGALRATLPAYLRSQRQVIIDAEALIRQRRSLSADQFRKRSLAIGDDQSALRLRYAQFLGGENEVHGAELPTSDAPTATVGKEEDVLGDFGHKHDEGEAATLFDPETRSRLTQAVDQMWQSEGALRSGDPARALPFANRALVLIKQVQQATRVFLAKVGSDLPPIDESRRMTGKRDDIAPSDPGLTALPTDRDAAAAWAAIDGAPGAKPDFAALTRWFQGNRQRLADPLAWADAMDGLRRDPGCQPCRVRLRELLWPALRRPPVAPARRAGSGDSGARYLDALAQGTGR